MSAKPIEATPTLYGKDAERFIKKMVQTGKRKMTKKEHEIFEMMMFTDKYLEVDGKKHRKPRCHNCGKAMKPYKDKTAGKITGYSWYCDCSGYPKGIVLCVG